MKYELLKKLPNHNIGEIWDFRLSILLIEKRMIEEYGDNTWEFYFIDYNKENPEWFEEIIENENKKIEELQILDALSNSGIVAKINEMIQVINVMNNYEKNNQDLSE